MRVDRYDDAVEAALGAARGAAACTSSCASRSCASGGWWWSTAASSDTADPRMTGVGVHALTADGAIGFASVDDVAPEAVRTAVNRPARWPRRGELDAEPHAGPFALWRAPVSGSCGAWSPAAEIRGGRPRRGCWSRRRRRWLGRPGPRSDQPERRCCRGRGVADRPLGRDGRELRDAARLAPARAVGRRAGSREPAPTSRGVDPAAIGRRGGGRLTRERGGRRPTRG